MARMDGTKTAVASASSNSQSMRSTIPVFVVKQLKLKVGDHLDWELDKTDDGTWVAKISKS